MTKVCLPKQRRTPHVRTKLDAGGAELTAVADPAPAKTATATTATVKAATSRQATVDRRCTCTWDLEAMNEPEVASTGAAPRGPRLAATIPGDPRRETALSTAQPIRTHQR